MTTTMRVTDAPTTFTYEREFDAGIEQLYKAHTDPKLLSQWWGVFDNTKTRVEEFQAHYGGKWKFVCYDDNGNEEYTFRGLNHIVEPTRLVYTFEFENEPGSVVLEEINFIENGNTTILRGTTAFFSQEARDAMLATGAEYGTEGSYKSLDFVLAKL